MKHFLSVTLVFFMLATGVSAGTPGAQCVGLKTDSARLACYDAAFGRTAAPQTGTRTSSRGTWKVQIDKSDFKDTKDIYLSVTAKKPVMCRQYGSPTTMRLYLRCQENTTAIFLTGDCHVASGFHGYGQVDVRIDQNKAFKTSMNASSDSSALGHWRGNRSIPLIKKMIDGDRVLFRFTPFGMSPTSVEFPITGLDEEIKALRKECGW